MDMELTKKERKIAHELIDKGIAEDFRRELLELDAILQKWKQEEGHNGDCFYTLYRNVREFNKWVGLRYDKIPGRLYIDTLIFQLVDGLYEPIELDEFRPEIKEHILLWVERRKKDKVLLSAK